MFTIPCVIGNHKLEKAMLDLGASINMMALSIYKDLNLVSLKEKKVIIQLADRSNSYLEGVVKDVLIRVNKLIFPMDFYIIDIDDEFASNPTYILLGRLFMKTKDFEYVFHVDVIDPIVQDELNFVLQHNKTGRDARLEKKEDMKESIMSLHSLLKILNRLVKSPLQLSNSYKRVLPFIEQALKLELKSLPKYLKYVFLGEDETLPMIIANDLMKFRVEELLRVV